MPEKTYPGLATANPITLVIFCPDPRFQEATDKFIGDDLGLKPGEYVRLPFAGGVASLSEPMRLPKDFKYVWDSCKFFVEHSPSIQRVVLINHEDCRKYAAMHGKVNLLLRQATGNMSDRQKRDLEEALRLFAKVVGRNLSIDLYYASYANPEHTQISIDKL